MNIFGRLIRAVKNIFVPEAKPKPRPVGKKRRRRGRKYSWQEIKTSDYYANLARFQDEQDKLEKAYEQLNSGRTRRVRQRAWKDFFGVLKDDFSFDLTDFDWSNWREEYFLKS